MLLINKKDVLIIEDDKNLSLVLQTLLTRKSYSVQTSSDGNSGLRLAKSNKFDLVISDIGLPFLDGLSIVKRLRSLDIRTPIIMMTSLTDIQNELESFENGSDIFHRKPLNYALLLSQISMLMRRHYSRKEIVVGDLRINTLKGITYKNDVIIELANKEFNLLVLLCSSPGEIFSRQDIISLISDRIGEVEESSIDTLVSRLRKKIGTYKKVDSIETVFKKGYRLNLVYLD